VYMLKSKPAKDPVVIATLYLSVGEKEHAYASLEKAYKEHNSNLLLLKTDPAFKGIRGEPRFKDLMRRVGFDTNPSDELPAAQGQ
jgi:hypothetical protein